MASIARGALRIKEAPSSLIDPAIVATACAGANHAWRERVLDPTRTLELFATQIAHANTAIAHVVRLGGGAFTASAYCQARARLPVSVVRAVLRATTEGQAGEARAALGTWKGHRTFLADGTGCDMPENAELQVHFGQPPKPGPGLGFPVASVLTLFDAASGLLLDMVVSPYATQDVTKIKDLHPHLRAGDVLIADRGFAAYAHLALLSARGVDAVVRSHQGRAIPHPAPEGPREKNASNRHRRKTPILVERLGEMDQIVELVKPHNRPGWMTPEEFAKVPGTMKVRVLKYTVNTPGFRTREVELMTTLLDAKAYPAEDLAELYRARWRVEVNLRHLKRTLGMTSLRCTSVEGVTKELLMFALVYNAACAVMVRAATRQGVGVDRVSFIDALRWIVHRRAEDDLPDLVLNPARAHRLYARYVKRTARFPKLTVPRATWKQRWLAKQQSLI